MSTSKFTSETLHALQRSLSAYPFSRFPISKYAANDLHLRKTEKLQKTRSASIMVRDVTSISANSYPQSYQRIPLCNRDGIASIMYTLRSQTVGTHKGQVSFPGGHNNDGEDEAAAARRETIEEIGESIGPIKVLGLGQTVYSVTGVLVTPVIGFIENDVRDLSHLKPAEEEVEKVFTRSLAELSDPVNKSYETYERNGKKATMPIWTVRKERIWGLTGVVTEAIVNAIAVVEGSRNER
eukprot:GSChrysophyteH1.ASY1.ANO1.2627.1 assembled CDS